MEKAKIIPSQLSICVERITKEIAQYYIATNTGNRSFKSADSIRLQKEFSNNNWIADSGQGIIFDYNGCLTDGMTRLQAFVKSNLEYLEITVIRGASPKGKFIYDTGKKRSGVAMLAIHGAKHITRANTILSFYERYIQGIVIRDNTPASAFRQNNNHLTNASIVKIYDRERAWIEPYTTIVAKYNSSQLKAISQRVLISIGYILYKNNFNNGKICDFLDFALLGIGADSDTAAFRHKLIAIEKNARFDDLQQVDFTMRLLFKFVNKDYKLSYPRQNTKLIGIEQLATIFY